jgi:hypothetical protein
MIKINIYTRGTIQLTDAQLSAMCKNKFDDKKLGEALRKHGDVIILAEDRRDVYGFIILSLDSDSAHIHYICSKKGGVGTLLRNTMLQYLNDHHPEVQSVTLVTIDDAYNFHSKGGFKYENEILGWMSLDLKK